MREFEIILLQTQSLSRKPFMLQSFETTDPPPPGHSGGLTKFSGDLTLFNNMLGPGGRWN